MPTSAKSYAKPKKPVDDLALADQAELACANLLAIADLMMETGQGLDTSENLLARVGELIRRETEALQGLLRQLYRR